jgi:hypothetical protein
MSSPRRQRHCRPWPVGDQLPKLYQKLVKIIAEVKVNSVPSSYQWARWLVTRFAARRDLLPPVMKSRRHGDGSWAATRRKHTTRHAVTPQWRVKLRGGIEGKCHGGGTITLLPQFSLLTVVASTTVWLLRCAGAKREKRTATRAPI